MKKLGSKGFSFVEVMLLIIIVGLLGGVSWYVYSQQKDVNKSLDNAQGNLQQLAQQNNEKDKITVGKVTFKSTSDFDENVRNEIITKVTDPLDYYYTEILKSEIKNIVVSTSSDEVYMYEVAHEGVDKTNNGSFLYGNRGEPIKYWYPDNCADDTNCSSYEQAFFKKFPESYKEYKKAQASSNTQ